MLAITIRNKKYVIPLDSIYYIESSSRKLIVHTSEQDYTYYQRLDVVETQLPSSEFIRIHKSYLVAFSYIDHFTNYKVILKNGKELSISATRRQAVKELLNHTIINSTTDKNESGITGAITCIKGAYEGSVIRMYSDRKILIGRDNQCDIRYNLPFVSRKQCVLIFRSKSNTYEITDCSTNGTFIIDSSNELSQNRIQISTPITPGIPTTLKPGTILHFGDSDNLFQLA